jgi:metallo-beta-lactamase class B
MSRIFLLAVLSAVALTPAAAAQTSTARSAECPSCAEWNAPQSPLKVFGNTYWVGPHGLGSILITSPQGHVLIDGGLPQSAPAILASIRALGFRVTDVKLILNSHAHWDHAGGMAELQRASGARVAASPWSAKVLSRGASLPDDPQYSVAPAYAPVKDVRSVADGDTLRVGPLALVAHFTGGHTPGGTTWSWRSCEGARCLNMVYADSQTPVSADDFLFTRDSSAIAAFEHGFGVLKSLPCDVLLTPHPDASRLWERVAARDVGKANALIDAGACRVYATAARDRLRKRLASEMHE